MAADWSALPLNLLSVITFKLKSLEDVMYFSTVCRSWNCASSSLKHQWRTATALPWLLLAENTKDNPNCVRKLFNLNNNKCYSSNLPETFGARCWGSPYGWVAVAKSDHTVQLMNPITKANISFPSLETILNLRKTNNAENFSDYNTWCLTDFLSKLIVLKVSHAGRNEFVIMIIYYDSNYLAFARQGDQSWTDILLIKETSIEILDVVAMDDHVYVVFNDGAIVYWNVKEFYGLEAVKPMDYSPARREIISGRLYGYMRYYLIKSGSDHLMVLRYKENVTNGLDKDDPEYESDYDIYYRTIKFKVYKLNLQEKNWEYIEDVGEVALFVGENSSMSISLAHDKCLQRNCIYFTDDENLYWVMVTEGGGHDMGVYDIKCGKVTRQFYQGVHTRSSFCPPTFFIPQLDVIDCLKYDIVK